MGMLIPFVTVTSRGGPHDDASYVAGYQCGRLDAKLAVVSTLDVLGARFDVVLAEASEPQADLLAMHHGFSLVRLGDPLLGWVCLRLVYVGRDAKDVEAVSDDGE